MFDQVFKIEISANAVAWYGAIVASISAFVVGYNVLRDRARLEIKLLANIGTINIEPDYDSSKMYYSIRVINKGRRPIRIGQPALKVVGMEHTFFIITSPSVQNNNVLTEENPSADFLVEQSKIDPAKIWYASIQTITGSEYRIYQHMLPTFWRIWYWLRYGK